MFKAKNPLLQEKKRVPPEELMSLPPEQLMSMPQPAPPQSPEQIMSMPQDAQPQPQPDPTSVAATAPTSFAPEIVGVYNVPGSTPRLTEADKAILGSQGRQVGIVQEAGAAGGDLNQQLADTQNAAAREMQGIQTEEEKVADLSHQTMQEQLADLQAQREELSKHQVTPKTFGEMWASKDTGQKILAGVGIALSTLGGFLGGRNVKKNIIDDAIDQDVERQQSLYDALNKNFGASEKLLQDTQGVFNNRLDSIDKRKIIALEKTKRLVEGLEARMAGAKEKANAQNLIEELKQKQAATEQIMWSRAQQRAKGSVQAAVRYGNTVVPMSLDKAGKLQNQERKFSNEEAKLGIDLEELRAKQQKSQREEEDAHPEIPGLKKTGEKAPRLSPAVAGKLVENAGNYLWSLDMLKQAKELASKGTNWSQEDRIRADQLQKDLVDGRLQGRGYGVPSAGEFARLESILTNPLQLTNWYESNKKRYQILEQATVNEANKKFRPLGYSLETTPSSDVKPMSRDTSNLSFKK